MSFVLPGKASVVIGGQFGSEGKGLIQGYIGSREKCDYAVTAASANAGHTCWVSGKKIVTYHLPMTGVLSPGATMVLSAGAIIDPAVLEKEIVEIETSFPALDVRSRIFIHPRAAVIEPQDVDSEGAGSGAARIASTQHGVGAALVRKIQRTAMLAEDCAPLYPYIGAVDLEDRLRWRARVVVEVPQGMGLGINSGYAYPHCTSREVSVAQGLADAQIHPSRIGNVMAVFRTFPIRVGHLYGPDGKITGNSGPFYEDGPETTWEAIGVHPEITTVTKRVRRVACFSLQQYRDALLWAQPTHVFLNFANYVSAGQLEDLIARMTTAGQAPTHLGYGPTINDVHVV